MEKPREGAENTVEEIDAQLKLIPDSPGVYLMKDELGEVIYVGKAKSLRRRVRSYFRKGSHTYKTRIMIEHIDDFDYILTDTEVEAYILEANLIKKYNPRFNIRLKDDKSYPYIKVTVNEDYPRVYKTRLVRSDGARYYGPFADVDAIYKTIDILKELFSLRTCRKELQAGKREERPCLNYHIGKCLGPCIGAVDRESYQELIERICLFFSGQQEELKRRVEKEMYRASREKNFEKAARYRDSLEALERLSTQQKVMSGRSTDRDVLALARDEEGQACVQILLVRNGRLIGQEYFLMEGAEGGEEEEIMSSFVQQYYEEAPQLPDEVLLSSPISQPELLADLLRQRKGRTVQLTVPERGEKKRMVEMAERNAAGNLKKESIKRKYREKRTGGAVRELGKYLGLQRDPDRIEGFDISNIQGTDPVASLVVFKGGMPLKQDYRRFRIKTVEGPNDFAMMQEVVERRYRRLLDEGGVIPDLVLIDGGKGQVNAAREVLDRLGLEGQQLIGLAKREEEVFFPGESEPVIIPKGSAALHLLQRVRDEAHRFAVSYHRKLRGRRLTHSMLDNIPGIGPKRRQALLQHFGSLGRIKDASISQLKEVEGISGKTARVIYDYLRENTRPF